jgi:hypothetical protein
MSKVRKLLIGSLLEGDDNLSERDAARMTDDVMFAAKVAGFTISEGWQPIETAPKEPDRFGMAVRILLACYGGKDPFACEGYWRFGGKQGWVSCMDPNVPAPYLEPLFWQPVPLPPNPSEKGEGE